MVVVYIYTPRLQRCRAVCASAAELLCFHMFYVSHKGVQGQEVGGIIARGLLKIESRKWRMSGELVCGFGRGGVQYKKVKTRARRQ